MNDPLTILIKLKKDELDIKRKQLAEIETHITRLNIVIKMLDDELLKEQEIVNSSEEIAFAYNGYYQTNRQKKEYVSQDLTNNQNKLDELQEAILIDFNELKRYEIGLEEQIKRQKEKEKKKEVEAMDELSINTFLKKSQNKIIRNLNKLIYIKYKC